ncbi:MAG: hypothetical protein DCC71_23425 [Proteobacteria bacterium]|nr:MAG: hypothetical protein DCC71_23425 [Pseudomonadota bacterium]
MAGKGARVIDSTLLVFVAVTAALALAVWLRGGGELLREGIGNGTSLLAKSGLIVAVSFVAAGLAEALVPKQAIPAALGVDSGLRGILLATGAGALTPSGPFVAIPIAAALERSGAGLAPLVAYVSAWGLLALHRLVAWEIPILGSRLALLRWGVCLLLPVVAGLLARWVTRGH